jgi:hypothetical protein
MVQKKYHLLLKNINTFEVNIKVECAELYFLFV